MSDSGAPTALTNTQPQSQATPVARCAARKERGILFSAPMVRAILAGKKTQTRRVLNPQPIQSIMDEVPWNALVGATEVGLLPESASAERRIGWTWRGTRIMPWPRALRNMSPYGTTGDRLWVRETWRVFGGKEYEYQRDSSAVQYRADETEFEQKEWRPSIFMPRWASRITLEVTEVRVQRVQEISEDDARAEGVQPFGEAYSCVGIDQRLTDGTLAHERPYRGSYAVLWDEINGDRPGCLWKDNPWVWAISFKRVSP